MQIRLQKILSLSGIVTSLLLVTNIALAQPREPPKKRLKSPAVVKGFIGGESHDSYVVHARKGRSMTVQISWRREDDNRAQFIVSESSTFFDREPLKFGKEYDDGKRWTGKIPRTGNYYIYVVAHPTAHYTLKVKIK